MKEHTKSNTFELFYCVSLAFTLYASVKTRLIAKLCQFISPKEWAAFEDRQYVKVLQEVANGTFERADARSRGVASVAALQVAHSTNDPAAAPQPSCIRCHTGAR